MSDERRYQLGPILMIAASVIGFVAVAGSVTLLLVAHMTGVLS